MCSSGAPCRTRRVLTELRVENLLLIERAELRLGEGLNVLTGETGAGKTVLASALDLLLGGRASPSVVRPGADEAYVEGVVEYDGEEVVLARKVSASGRSRALLNGRTVTVAELREVAERVLLFYGQHEHQKLTLAGAQRALLDAACGPDQAFRLAGCAAAHDDVRGAENRLDSLRELAGARERELDLVAFELAEIESVDPGIDEEIELLGRRERLRHVDALRAAAGTAVEAISADDGGAASALAAGGGALQTADRLDPALDALAARMQTLLIEASDLAGELRGYGEALDGDPAELELVEDRLAAIDRLKRKHGGSVSSVLDHAAVCRARRDELLGAEVAMEEASAALSEAIARRAELAADISEARRGAAPGLEHEVRDRLAALAMPDAGFAVSLGEKVAGPDGADQVEFLLAPNPGVPQAPLGDTASGGELSRVMLALLTSVNTGSSAALVFDEIDAGIGGRTARAVGEQLRALAADRQVLCITHLPQVAAQADRHFSIAKDTTSGTARTTVTALERGAVEAELVRMLGAEDDDLAARRHAKTLLAA